jgi:phosphopantetheinyl transferase
MAELFRRNITDGTLYAIWKITESTDELRSSIHLSPGEEDLYGNFVAESRKKQWLAYRLLIRAITAPFDYPVEYDDCGKPFLAGSDLHISVTHTDDLAAVIMSRHTRVGIDIEKIRPRILKVKDKFISDDESLLIDKEHSLEQLTLAWCAKEALYKLYGLRNLDFRDDMRVDIPSCAGKSFRATIRNGNEISHYELFSEKFGEFILVYLAE